MITWGSDCRRGAIYPDWEPGLVDAEGSALVGVILPGAELQTGATLGRWGSRWEAVSAPG